MDTLSVLMCMPLATAEHATARSVAAASALARRDRGFMVLAFLVMSAARAGSLLRRGAVAAGRRESARIARSRRRDDGSVAIDRTEGAFALELRAASVRPRALAPRSARRGATRRRRRARVRRSRRGSGLAFARRSRTLFEMAGSPPRTRLPGGRRRAR